MISNNEKIRIVETARRNKKSQLTALVKAGCNTGEANRFLDELRYSNDNSNTGVPKAENKISFTESKGEAVLESNSTIRTLEDLLKISKVDLNVWEVERHIINKYEVARKDISKTLSYEDGVVNGESGDTGKMNVYELFQVKVWFKKKKNSDISSELMNYFKAELGKSINIDKWKDVKKAISSKDKKYCLELAVPDLHVGKLAHKAETGDNFDSSIAVEVFKQAIDDLVSKAPMTKVERIVFPVGNDFFNTDGSDNETSGGTPQDVDSRWQHTFKKGCDLITEVVEKLALTHPVDILMVAGNHDVERNFYLGSYLQAYFRQHANVTVDNAPTRRKYYRYGQTLIAFTHGSEEKHSTLPLIMATERKQLWAETSFREVHLGHFHKESNNEYNGVKVRFLPALCPADAWHSQRGYVGTTRSATAFLYEKNKGLEAQLYFNL